MATSAVEQPTVEQIRRAVMLLSKAGYDTVFIDAKYRRLGATMSEGDCSVNSWLASKNAFELDMLIDRLQNEPPAEVRAKSITPPF